ncbi:MAG: sulfatase-like hydrolase/transferase [Kiritimatiellales bacterium]|nr:sulfatase-like hydrolase/transferase [Kiritimatiellales bacterium]MCF7864050.1 sulfatase-like hydrolase/transferase [Kiritimatiellales bacterium]
MKNKLCLIVLAAVLAGAAKGAEEHPGRRPNVVFILSDDHRADLMEFMGNPYIKTPILDQMARDGAVFQNAFCTAAVCTPSRASFWTGRYSEKTGAPCIVDQATGFIELSRVFAEDLHDNGYTTAFVGKWHLGDGKTPKRGFDYWASWDWVGNDFDFIIHENGLPVQMRGFTDDNTSRMAAEFIQTHAGDDKPFFLYLGLKAPHLPYAYPERIEHAFDGVDIPRPASFDENYDTTGKLGLKGTCIRAAEWTYGIPKFGSWENYVKSYYRAAQSIDGSVGTVLRSLKDAGLDNNTLVIYSSDQGYHIGDHGLTEKHYTYRNVLHIPLLIRYPGLVAPGTVSDDLVSAIDVAPTILNACGVKSTAEMDGKSLLPLLENGGHDPDPREDIFCAFDADTDRVILRGNSCVRTRQYKLIWFSDINHCELYDVQKDPEEMNNLAGNLEFAATLKEMKQRLERKIKETSWGQLEKHPFTGTCYVLGPVAIHDEEAVRKAIAVRAIDYSSPIRASGNTYAWKPVKVRGPLAFEKMFGNPGDRGFVAFPVINKQDSVGFLQMDVGGNGLPLMGIWDGRVVFGNKLAEEMLHQEAGFHQKFFEYCPPLQPGRNDVVVEFAVEGGKPPNFDITLTYAKSLLELPSMDCGKEEEAVPLRLRPPVRTEIQLRNILLTGGGL